MNGNTSNHRTIGWLDGGECGVLWANNTKWESELAERMSGEWKETLVQPQYCELADSR